VGRVACRIQSHGLDQPLAPALIVELATFADAVDLVMPLTLATLQAKKEAGSQRIDAHLDNVIFQKCANAMCPRRVYRHLEAEAFGVVFGLCNLDHEVIQMPGDVGTGQTKALCPPQQLLKAKSHG
jgi:hypothetical protein